MLPDKVVKRNGQIETFRLEKVAAAIFRAAASVGGNDKNLAEELSKDVLKQIEEAFPDKIPLVEHIQDIVEKTLIERGHARTAKAYIIYRHQRDQEREQRALILGNQDKDENLDFSYEALKILERRYLKKGETGQLGETPAQMLRRVAKSVAQADADYGTSKTEVAETEEKFYRLMSELKFLPNTPTLMNAGNSTQQLNACFVLPIEDTMQSIFGTLRHSAIVHQRGGGTGFSFSRLRPKGDKVGMHFGVASGPVAFLNVYDTALEVVKQGGVRPGANMAVLKVDHPDILRFVEAKRNTTSLNNFNISVAVTDRFMKAVEEDRDYMIKSPRTEKYVGKLRARDVFAVITQNAWKTGDPGLLFIDEINRKHPAQQLGEIEATNQCAEAPLLPYESCALGAIDVAKFVAKREIDWEKLSKAVRTSIHFLDNVVDVNTYPTKKVQDQSQSTRKLGLGVMGFANLLFKLRIKYDSEEGLQLADKLLGFIKETAYQASQQLAEIRGVCPAWEGSTHQQAERKMRNITCLALSPTGTRSILADTSAGCEPAFALCYQRTLLGTQGLVALNSVFEKQLKERELYTSGLIRKVSYSSNIQNIKEIPKDMRDIFVTAQDISPEWHIKMQTVLQKHVDNAISKTINFPSTAAIRDVEEAYLTAWKGKCKGITIYRDGSYEDQVINIGEGL